MHDLFEAMNIRKEETDIIIRQIEEAESSGRAFNKPCSIHKALIYMMCYNTIESIVYLSLELLFDEIYNKCEKFSEISNSLQIVYNKYYSSPKCSYSRRDFEQRHRLAFDEYSKIVITFSGNLDARKIREILNVYGIERDFHVTGESELLVIKHYRNQLAHGKLSYNDVGRNFAISDIKKTCDAAYDYLASYQVLFTEFITEKRYLQNT